MTSREFMALVTRGTGAASIGTVVMVSLYLLGLLDLSSEEWRGFFQIVGVLFVLLFAAVTFVNSRKLLPIISYLRNEEQGRARVHRSELREAFANIANLPHWMYVSGVMWWALGGALVALAMAIRYETFGLFPAFVMIASATSGGFVSTTFLYFWMKNRTQDLRRSLGSRVGSAAKRAELVQPVPLRAKLLVSMTGVNVVAVVFAILLSVVRAGTSLEEAAVRHQHRYLEQNLFTLESGGEDAFSFVAEGARQLELASELLLVDTSAQEVVVGSAELLREDELAMILARTESGDSRAISSSQVFTWRAIPGGGRIVVAVQPWEKVRGDWGLTWALFGAVAGISMLIAYSLAHVLSSDVGRAAGDLGQSANRIAAGDLRETGSFESEDELGRLGRSFEDMASSMRGTLTTIAGTADTVDEAATEVSDLSQALAGQSETLRTGVEQSLESVSGINRQVGALAESAGELNLLVEESSSSILEMGAATEQLNDTAGVLSSKVDEVAGSVDQMIQSVEAVSGHSNELAEVASHTSTSMEEMASSMRLIDTAADQTAQLSSQVIEAAERGRAKVLETIEGMDEIRSATEAADQVMQSLGERTKEIGAVLDVIDGVADETSLLALNAAIIAAQAGEHGRAFSVVADEIKELANRVISSTKEIGDLIHAVQQESQNAVGAVLAGAESVAQGVERSMDAGRSLEEILLASRESSGRIHEIVSSVREQSKAAVGVNEMMEKVTTGVDAIQTALAEQKSGNEVVGRATVAMREVARQMRGTTTEQSSGANRIRENIDGVRSATELINQTLQAQKSACQAVNDFLEETVGQTRIGASSSDRLAGVTEDLKRQAEALRAGLSRFTF